LQVIRNSLAKRAFQDTSLEPLGRSLEGPCALVTTSESLIDAAKALVKTAEEFEHLTLKQALVDGDPDLSTVVQVSKMKGQAELVGELAVILLSPGRVLAGCVGSAQSRIAGCLKTIIDRAA
jgi:large subunit ribosomal protein L10